MDLRPVLRPAAAGVILFLTLGAAPQRDSATLVALGKIERGQWQLKEAGGPAQKLCLGNPAQLLQLRHRGANCSQVVIENSANTATVHYTCPSRGYGRTTVSVETGRLVRIETTGIVDGAPFSAELEGRKLGACN